MPGRVRRVGGRHLVTVGAWNAALHAEYRGLPPGAKKRAIADRLIRENEPLVKTLVSQLLGRGVQDKRRTAAAKMGGKDGFHELDLDDALQAGRFALVKALDSYDPTKGGIAIHLLWKIRYELQCVATTASFVRTPPDKRHLRPEVGLVGLQANDEDLASARAERAQGRHEDLLESLTPAGGETLRDSSEGWEGLLEDAEGDPRVRDALSEWERTGVWPELLASTDAYAATRPVRKAWSFPSRPAVVVVVTGLDVFMRRCTIATGARVDVASAYNAYRIECRLSGHPELPRVAFVKELTTGWDVRETVRRVGRSSSRALAGLRMQFAPPPAYANGRA